MNDILSMKNQKYEFWDNCAIIMALLASISFLGGVTGYSFLTSLSFACSILLVVFVCFLDLLQSQKIDKILPFLLIFMILSLVNSGIKLNFDYYKRLIITFCTFICIIYSAKVRISEKTKKTVVFFFALDALIVSVYYYLLGYNKIYFGTTESIIFNFSNPNETALWLFGLFIILFSGVFLIKNYFSKCLLFIECLLLFMILEATESRNSLFACIFFIVTMILCNIGKVKKIPKWFLLLLVILPIIIFFFYMYFFLPNEKSVESFLIELGFELEKGLTTREDIWQIVIDNFSRCFLFGDYLIFNEAQMHNSLMTLFCMYGAFFVVIACICMYRTCKRLQERISPLAALTMGAIFFSGCFEASVFVGVAGFYLVLFLAPSCVLKKDK